MIRVWLDGVDVTYWVVTKNLPEWLETSVKGPGWFEWRVSSFDFRLHDSAPVTPAIGLACVISVGAATLSGQIGKLEDISTHVPRITVDPPALALKEVMAGSQEFTEEGRLRWLFELSGVTLQEAAEQLLSTYNEERPSAYPMRNWTVQVLGDPENPVQGLGPHELTGPTGEDAGYESAVLQDVMNVTGNLLLTYHLLYDGVLIGQLFPDFAPGNITHVHQLATVRLVNGQITGAIWKTATPVGGHQSLLAQPVFSHSGPPADNIVPATPGGQPEEDTVYAARWQEYVTQGQDLQPTSERVEDDLATAWVRKQTHGTSTDFELLGYVDCENGTWAFHRAFEVRWQSQTYGMQAHLYATWWSDPLVQLIRGRWANKSMAALLQIFALITGHMLKFDESTVVFVPRTDGEVNVIDPDPGKALKPVEDRIETTSPPDVSVETQDPDAEAEDRWGLDYSAGDVVALSWWYTYRFGGPVPVRDAEFPIALLPENARLLAASGAGTWTELDFSTDGKRFRYHTIREGA